MDILHLVDRLEQLFNESRSIPLTHNVVIDEDRFLEIIDQMRVSIPEEVRKAQQIVAERDRLLAQANEQAARTLSQAREKAEALVQRDGIVQSANVRAEQILGQAKVDAEATRRDADEYVIVALGDLEMELTKTLGQVRNGIAKLRADHGQPVSADGSAP